MSLFEKRNRPGTAEYLLAVFVALGSARSISILANVASEDALAVYQVNPVIRLLAWAALLVDVFILLTIVAMAIGSRWPGGVQRALGASAVLAAGLTWFELWYGSTFYYGEIRDKQGMPVGVNNLGALGSFCFLAYVIWRINLPSLQSRRWRFAAIVGLGVAQYLVLKVVEEPWQLWQS